MAVKTSFPEGAILDMSDASYSRLLLPLIKLKSFICRSFFKIRDDPFIHVCKISHNLFSIDFLWSSFYKSLLV